MGLGKLGKLVISNSGKSLCKNIASKALAKPANINLFSKPVKPIKGFESSKRHRLLAKASKKQLEKQIKTILNSRKKALHSNILESLRDNFKTKKARLVEEYLKIGEKELANHISKAKTPEQISKILAQNDMGYMAKMVQEQNKFIPTETCKIKPLTLEQEQVLYGMKMHRGKLILAREKAFHISSKKTEVIAIENILKTQYGCEFVSLKDNEIIAKQVLKAFETAKKNNAPLPKNVIVSDNMIAEGENFFNGTILLNSKPTFFGENFMSTTSDYHAVLHEILHSSHPNLISFSNKKIPKKFMDVKHNLSTYSSTSATHETFTELNTKRMIEGLSPEEQELFNYLNYFA